MLSVRLSFLSLDPFASLLDEEGADGARERSNDDEPKEETGEHGKAPADASRHGVGLKREHGRKRPQERVAEGVERRIAPVALEEERELGDRDRDHDRRRGEVTEPGAEQSPGGADGSVGRGNDPGGRKPSRSGPTIY